MPNYLNPTVVELDDVNFEKIDFEPGTGVFKSADFAILDAGSMQNLNITVDRDGERYTKQLQGVCFVDSWAINRGPGGDIDDNLAPVDDPHSSGHGNYVNNPYNGLTGIPSENTSQLEAGPDPANFYRGGDVNGVEGAAPGSDPALAYDGTYYHPFRGEMQLSTLDARGYDFVDPVKGGDGGSGADAYVHPNRPSASGAGTYEFLTEPKFSEDVTYITTDASGEILYSDAKRVAAGGTKYVDLTSSDPYKYIATDENGEFMPYVPITGISGKERPKDQFVVDLDGSALLTQSNSIMHVNITRDIKSFDKNQTPEAFDQRRKRGTRDLLQGIVFCSMVKKIFNTGADDADLELKNVDFSAAEERESGLFFVNIEDSEVVQITAGGDGVPLQQGNTSENYPSQMLGTEAFKDWMVMKLGAAARAPADYEGNVNTDETKREFDLRREFLRLTDPNFGTISDFKRDADGRQLYLDGSGAETTDKLPPFEGMADHIPLYEYSAVIEGSGKDRTFTIPNDVLHKTLLAFNGYKRGRRAIDVDEEHGKVDVSGDWTDAALGVAKVVTTPSEWYPPEPLGAGDDPVNNRVDGQTLDDEIKYWNFRTAQGSDGVAVTDGEPHQELEYVPFVRFDKMMVYYTIDIFFQQKSLAEVTPDGLNALTIEGSTSTETGDVVTTEGVGYDFYDTKLNFILEWVLTHEDQNAVGERNSSQAADQTATATHYQTVPGKKNVWEDDWNAP